MIFLFFKVNKLKCTLTVCDFFHFMINRYNLLLCWIYDAFENLCSHLKKKSFYKTRITVDFHFTEINKCKFAVAVWVRQVRKSLIIIDNVSTNRRTEYINHRRYYVTEVNSIIVTHYTVLMFSCVGNNNCKPAKPTCKFVL